MTLRRPQQGARLLFLVRHPETDWNRERRYQGRSGRPLSDAGSASVAKISADLRRRRPELVVSSPTSHAAALAARIAEEAGAAGPVPADHWREIDHGTWEGLHHEEIVDRYGSEAEARFDDPLHYDGHGGETLSHAAQRVGRAWDDLLGLDWTRVAVVTHVTPIRLALCRCLGCPVSSLWRIRIDNGSVTGIEIDGQSPMVSFVNRRPDS